MQPAAIVSGDMQPDTIVSGDMQPPPSHQREDIICKPPYLYPPATNK